MRSFFVFVFLFLLNTRQSLGNRERNVNNGLLTSNARLVFKEYLRNFLGFPNFGLNDPGSLYSEDDVENMLENEWINVIEANTSDHCARDLIHVGVHIKEKWALSMLDANGKLPPGVLYGNLAWSGAYKECLETKAPPPSNTTNVTTSFSGKYCTLYWNISTTAVSGNVGLCVPDSCDEQDFMNVSKFKHVLKNSHFISNINQTFGTLSGFNVQQIYCQKADPRYDTGAYIVAIIFYIFTFLVTVATACTVIEKASLQWRTSKGIIENEYFAVNVANLHEDEKISDVDNDLSTLIFPVENKSFFYQISKFLKCFCLLTNGKKIFDTSDKGDSDMRCIYGIRFLSMCWIILGHTYVFVILTPSVVLGNILDVFHLIDNLAFEIILQATYAVDSFFLMSGFLLTYLFLKQMDKSEGKTSWLMYYIHRYWRITPVYAMVMAFDTKLTSYLISGPFKPAEYESGCKISWWKNLLYINNFISIDAFSETCMGWSWYLANDMQFYVISPIFLYLLWRYPKIGVGVVCLLFCGTSICNFTIGYIYKTLPTLGYIPKSLDIQQWVPMMMNYGNKIYLKPYTRIGPYLIGVILGFMLFRLKGQKNVLTFKAQVFGWIMSTATGLYLMFGLYHADFHRVETAFFLAFSRSLFSVCLAWVIFACLTGHGGPINSILSFSAFIPLGRITYCAYLIHPIIMMIYYLSLPTTIIMTHFQMTLLFLGFLTISYIFALFLSLLFESPTMTVEKFIKQLGSKNRQKEGTI